MTHVGTLDLERLGAGRAYKFQSEAGWSDVYVHQLPPVAGKSYEALAQDCTQRSIAEELAGAQNIFYSLAGAKRGSLAIERLSFTSLMFSAIYLDKSVHVFEYFRGEGHEIFMIRTVLFDPVSRELSMDVPRFAVKALAFAKKRPNKTPQSTTPPVTPPAGQEAGQP
jgi:hypothetical protein